MINIKFSGIIAGLACVISLIIGIFSRSSMPSLIVRPLIFAVVFFALSCVIYYLLKSFLPELFDSKAADDSTLPGTHVDITEGGTPDFSQAFSEDVLAGSEDANPSSIKPAFMNSQEEHSEKELGNISDLMGRYVSTSTGDETSIGMDQNAQEGYTEIRNMEELSKFANVDGGSDSSLAADSSKLPGESAGSSGASTEALPDLDAMAGAFMPASGGGETEATEYTVPTPVKKPSSASKAAGWSGDFKPEEIAAGLRTILKKEG